MIYLENRKLGQKSWEKVNIGPDYVYYDLQRLCLLRFTKTVFTKISDCSIEFIRLNSSKQLEFSWGIQAKVVMLKVCKRVFSCEIILCPLHTKRSSRVELMENHQRSHSPNRKDKLQPKTTENINKFLESKNLLYASF